MTGAVLDPSGCPIDQLSVSNLEVCGHSQKTRGGCLFQFAGTVVNVTHAVGIVVLMPLQCSAKLWRVSGARHRNRFSLNCSAVRPLQCRSGALHIDRAAKDARIALRRSGEHAQYHPQASNAAPGASVGRKVLVSLPQIRDAVVHSITRTSQTAIVQKITEQVSPVRRVHQHICSDISGHSGSACTC